jgi:hypothetical protein
MNYTEKITRNYLRLSTSAFDRKKRVVGTTLVA